MRKKSLKHATIGVVLAVIITSVLLGVIRARETPGDKASALSGATLFTSKGCSHCHYTDTKDTKIGPGLKDLFARDVLPVSKRPVSEENVLKQLQTPYKNMPSFAGRLTNEEKNRLIDYLKTL